MDKAYLQNSFKVSTRDFYRTYFFETTNKKWLSAVIFAIFISETLEKIFFSPVPLTQATKFSYIFISIAFLCYGFFFFTCVLSFCTHRSTRILKYRYFLVIVSVLFFSLHRAIDISQEACDLGPLSGLEKPTYPLSKVRSELWLILVIDNLIPTWYLKLVIPGCYWITQIIASNIIKKDPSCFVLYSFISSMVYITAIWRIKASNEWDAFFKQSKAETWIDTLTNIIDKTTNAVALIDGKKKIIYSNINFKALCDNSLDNLSQKFSSIKKLANWTDSDYFNEHQILTPTTSNQKDGLGSNEGPWNSIEDRQDTEIFPNFMSLLNEVTTLPKNSRKYKEESHLMFSAQTKPMLIQGQSTQSYEIKFSHILRSHGEILLIISNITQKERANSLEVINQYKDKLLATVSHDMRAPLNGGLTFIENAMQQEDVSEATKEKYLIPAERSCKFLLHLTNDILDFAQMNAKKLRMNFEKLSLVETLKTCYQLLEMQANFKKIDFHIVLDKNLPVRFSTDHNRLSQIIINLLTNAIKFTSEGEVKLTAQAINKSLVQIKVSDTGIGIKQEDQNKLFKEFTRVKYEQANINSRGVGLGLLIANKLAKILGPDNKKEKINVSSVYGEGTVFSFLLKEKTNEDNLNTSICKLSDMGCLTNSPETEIKNGSFKEEDFLERKIEEMDPLNINSSPRYPYSSAYSLRRQVSPGARLSLITTDCSAGRDRTLKGKVLIVDDNPLNVLALESILKPYGIISDSASNGKEAISKIVQNSRTGKEIHFTPTDTQLAMSSFNEQGNKYQLIFLDCEMPVMDGFDTSKTLVKMMKEKQIRDIPIIGYTGYTHQERLDECIKSGMTDIIGKPPQRAKLLSLVNKYVFLENNTQKEFLFEQGSL